MQKKKPSLKSNPQSHHTVAHFFNQRYSNGFYYYEIDVPSEVSFILFVSVWTMIVTIYLLLAPLKFPSLAPVIAILALDAITMLFWFAAFIALAVWKSNLFDCYGGICDKIIAGIVFGAFEWYVFFLFFPSFSSHTINTPYTFVMEKVVNFSSHHNLNDFANHISSMHRLLFVITTALSALTFSRRGSATAPAPPTTTV